MDTVSIRNMSNSQKVAALLIALGPRTASEIMKNIADENEVEHIALEIASLQKLNPETLNEVLAEFYTIFQASGYLATGGVGYARQLLEEAYGSGQADKILERLVATLQTNPFDFFNNADPAQLATSFQNENPQLVALVLAYLKPDRSAAILSALSPEMQAEVASRIAEMDRTNPEVLREVERIMENKFSSVVTADFSMAGGIESLAEILNRSDRTTEKAILDVLELKDPELSEQVRELMFVFEDIIHLDDRAIQRILREVDTKDLALSLKGSNDEVKEKIFKNMSERASAMLKDDMDYMGPVRAKDVSEKQTHIVGIIRALEGAGEIVVSRGAEEDDFVD
ncbi:MAG: flagellar motor switch protein FliG [Vampirovibrionales bacterium]|nr:flagellar motor switch protein FliG [Vampirovibrionales bacterium]